MTDPLLRRSSAAHVFRLGSDTKILTWNFHSDTMQAGSAGGVVSQVVLFGQFGSNTFNDRPNGIGLIEIQNAAAGQLCEGFHCWLVDQTSGTDWNKVQQNVGALRRMRDISKARLASVIVAV